MRKWIQESPISVGVGLVALGLIVIFLAWNGAASKDFVEGQVPYLISGGLTGLALVGSGLTVIVVQTHRRESAVLTDKLDELIDAVRAMGSAAGAGATAGPTAGPNSGPTAVPEHGIVIAGRSTYHVPTCRLVEGRDDLQAMNPEAATQRGLTPCRICKPRAGTLESA
ncbi:MAG: hypothetical protein ACRD0U_11425 [Acidimicrobiales bacterium]